MKKREKIGDHPPRSLATCSLSSWIPSPPALHPHPLQLWASPKALSLAFLFFLTPQSLVFELDPSYGLSFSFSPTPNCLWGPDLPPRLASAFLMKHLHPGRVNSLPYLGSSLSLGSRLGLLRPQHSPKLQIRSPKLPTALPPHQMGFQILETCSLWRLPHPHRKLGSSLPKSSTALPPSASASASDQLLAFSIPVQCPFPGNLIMPLPRNLPLELRWLPTATRNCLMWSPPQVGDPALLVLPTSSEKLFLRFCPVFPPDRAHHTCHFLQEAVPDSLRGVHALLLRSPTALPRHCSDGIVYFSSVCTPLQSRALPTSPDPRNRSEAL